MDPIIEMGEMPAPMSVNPWGLWAWKQGLSCPCAAAKIL